MTTDQCPLNCWQDEFNSYLDLLFQGNMLSVQKFVLKPKETVFEMPKSAKVLSIKKVGDDICFWAMIDDTDQDLIYRRFAYYFTGHKIPNQPMEYLGSEIMSGGKAEVHVFELLG